MKDHATPMLTGSQLVFLGTSVTLTVIGLQVGFDTEFALAAAAVATIVLSLILAIRSITVETAPLPILTLQFWLIFSIFMATHVRSERILLLGYSAVLGVGLTVSAYAALKFFGVKDLARSVFAPVGILSMAIPILVRHSM